MSLDQDWATCKLGDVVTLKRGYDLPHRDRVDGEYPIVSSSGITGYHNAAKVRGPGVVTGRYGTLGEVFYITGGYWPLNTSLYVQDFKGNYPRFIAYFLKTLGLGNRSGAAAVPGVNRNALHLLPVRVPNPSIQRKIASIISAYDDLIENNLRRIKILEEMAQSLYREWFVKFRFPGYEKVPLVDSPMGKIPEGWEVTKLANVCELVMGQSPKSEFYNERGDGLPFHQGVTHFAERFPVNRVYCTALNRIAEAGDILFSVRAPVGRINIAESKLIIGRGLAAIRSRTGCRWFVFRQMKERFKDEDMMGGGTIFKAVTKHDMESIEFLKPREEIISAFVSLCDPIEGQIGNLTKKNHVLRRTRDLLLPKLISGELDVSDLDIKVPEELL